MFSTPAFAEGERDNFVEDKLECGQNKRAVFRCPAGDTLLSKMLCLSQTYNELSSPAQSTVALAIIQIIPHITKAPTTDADHNPSPGAFIDPVPFASSFASRKTRHFVGAMDVQCSQPIPAEHRNIQFKITLQNSWTGV
jgi:hypothetical protein